MDITQYYTHQKRPYQAMCTQVVESNFKTIIDLIESQGDEATQFGPDCILVRFKYPQAGRRQIESLHVGWWVVVGENGLLKCYDNETFKIKYEEMQ